ncbi:MAG TPA: hypothetical protein VN944_09150, partial [Nitrospiria bacterium]|nr:hypothetical protein [Nitrospiria bacterium]
VVAGTSSPTAMTDKDGNFTLAGVPTGTVSVNVITPGYNTNNFSVNVSDSATTAIPAAIHLPDIDDMSNAPVISNASAPFSNGAFAVTATITPTSTVTITDARAELVGYGTGSVLMLSSATYTGAISLPGSFVGPSALIKIFAIDSKGRVGVKVLVVAVPGASSTGSFNAAALNGTWGGTAEYHHPSFGNGDLLGDIRFANVSFTVSSGSSVTANAATINIESYIPPSAWVVTTKSSTTGNASLIDASLGLYAVTSQFNPSSSRTVTMNMLGKLDSATAPSSFVGYFEATIVDTAPPSGTTILLGHFSLKNNLTWVSSDLDGNWVWSEFIKTSAINTTYLAPFQFTSSFTGTSGVFAGKDTLGYSLSNNINFSMIDASVGLFGGTVNSNDPASSTVTFFGLLGPYKRHMTGLFTVSSSGKSAYGPFWGGKVTTPPLYALADFAQKRFDGSTVNSIWRGFYYVTGAHDIGKLCYLSLWADSGGIIVGGKVLPIPVLGPAPACPTVGFTSGTLSFTDGTDGQVNGSATDVNTLTTFALAPSSSRKASMGVYKERLVGDFSINANGGTDTGFFFLQRVLIE